MNETKTNEFDLKEMSLDLDHFFTYWNESVSE